MEESTTLLTEVEEEAYAYFEEQLVKSGRYRVIRIDESEDKVVPPVSAPEAAAAFLPPPPFMPHSGPSPLVSAPKLSIRPTSGISSSQTFSVPPVAPQVSYPAPFYSLPTSTANVSLGPFYSTPMTHAPMGPRPTMQSYLSSKPFMADTNNGNVKVPKLSDFNGETKGDEFDIWAYEVNCLLRSNKYPDHIILEAIRRSLKGRAKSVLLHLGEKASVQDVMSEMEGLFGNVASAEKLKEKFYSATQEEGETVADFSLRLEHLLRHSSVGLEQGTRNEMLRGRLWSGLRNSLLKNVSRYKYETVTDFNQLRKELRKIELDLEKSVKENVKERKKESFTPVTEGVQKKTENVENVNANMTSVEHRLLKQMQDMTDQFKRMTSRMDAMEKELKESKKGSYYGNKKWDKGKGGGQNKKGSQKGDGSKSDNTGQETLNESRPPPKGQ